MYSNIESSGSEMNIPITDVYFATGNNNVITLNIFRMKMQPEMKKLSCIFSPADSRPSSRQ